MNKKELDHVQIPTNQFFRISPADLSPGIAGFVYMKFSLYLLLTFSVSAYGATSHVSVQLTKATKCMTKVLKSMAGVSDVKVGRKAVNGSTFPFIQYRSHEGTGSIWHLKFMSEQPTNGRIVFNTSISGLGPPKLPVTSVVVSKWKAQCGVDVVFRFE